MLQDLNTWRAFDLSIAKWEAKQERKLSRRMIKWLGFGAHHCMRHSGRCSAYLLSLRKAKEAPEQTQKTLGGRDEKEASKQVELKQDGRQGQADMSFSSSSLLQTKTTSPMCTPLFLTAVNF